MRFLTFGASQRLGSYNRQLAMVAGSILRDANQTVDHANYHEFIPPVFDDQFYDRATLPNQAQEFIQRLERADALVLSAPEYNWSISGSLKNLIDWVSCVNPYPFANKPVLLLCATPSRRGGVEGLNHLRSCLTGMQACVYPRQFALGGAKEELIEDQKNLNNSALQNELEELIFGFIEYANRLNG
jgi:NAD(P)H-dependent FMN reductase